jgi:hypothetical protein
MLKFHIKNTHKLLNLAIFNNFSFFNHKGRLELQSGLLLKIVYSGYIFKVTPNLTADKVP